MQPRDMAVGMVRCSKLMAPTLREIPRLMIIRWKSGKRQTKEELGQTVDSRGDRHGTVGRETKGMPSVLVKPASVQYSSWDRSHASSVHRSRGLVAVDPGFLLRQKIYPVSQYFADTEAGEGAHHISIFKSRLVLETVDGVASRAELIRIGVYNTHHC